MHLFYSPDIRGDLYELDEDESKHSVRVLRLRRGDHVNLVDGTGGWYEAIIEEAHPRNCRFRILSRIQDHRPLPYMLHLAISPTKSMDRFEWFLEKATEIGVSQITPLLCRRTERTKINKDRLERVVIAAMKQSLRAYKPLLHPPSALEDFLRSHREGVKGITHCMPGERTMITELPHSENYTLVVGPEGDFTEEEIELALKAGYVPYHLGDARLRTETAGVYICTAVSLLHKSRG